MNLRDVTYLASDAGKGLLERIGELSGDSLTKQGVLRKDYPAEYVRAAMALMDLRERGRRKFRDADRMFFDRDGLEQASGDVIAEHRAKRYAGCADVVDVCCGIGGDSVALARMAKLTSVDVRPERVRMARENMSVSGLTAKFACADVRYWCPSGAAFFIDPSRREGGRRVVHLNDYAPSFDELPWLRPELAVGIKVAPGIDHEELPDGCETEFISVAGECREAILWFGALQSGARVRATLLPSGDSIAHAPVEPVPCGEISAYLYEPDRAVIRAHLVEQVATRIGARKLAPDVAYLTSETQVDSPYARVFSVEAVLPFSIKRVQAYVKDQGIGRLDIKKRRFPMTSDAVFGKLKLKGCRSSTLILTRVEENPVAIFCQPEIRG